jgi:hypothetical protein
MTRAAGTWETLAMLGFFGTLGVAVISKIVGTLVLVGAVVFGVWWWTRTPADDELSHRRELPWQAEHLRKAVVGQAVEAIVDAVPQPGVKNSILLAPFSGDSDRVELRKAIFNSLLRQGYNHKEVRLLDRAIGIKPAESAAAVVATDKGWFDRLKDVLPFGGFGSGSGSEGDKQEEPGDSLCYVEGIVSNDFKSESPKLTLRLAVAEVTRKNGKWQRTEETAPLATFSATLENGSLEWWQVYIRNTHWLLRLVSWFGLVLVLPWAAAPLIKAVVRQENNALAAGLLGFLTVAGTVAAWVLLGLPADGIGSLVLPAAALAAAGLYNFIVCEALASRYEV